MGTFHVDEPLFIAFLVFLLSFVIQMAYLWFIHGKLAFYRKKQSAANREPISVILNMNDEFEKLQVVLPVLLEQDYPDYEVVLVIQTLNDDLVEYLDRITSKYPQVKIVEMLQNLNFFKGNKFAISIGIKSARNDILVFTEAGCRPLSSSWLSEMQSCFSSGKEVVLAYHNLAPDRGDIASSLIRFANFQSGLKYLSHALAGDPYMGMGKNLAYRKSLFYRHQGFISHYQIEDGADDLFVNRVATERNVAISVHPDSRVVCDQPYSFGQWFRLRKKYFRTRHYYKPRHRFYQNFFSITQFIFLASFVGLVSIQYLLYYTLAMFGIRLFSQLFIYKKCMNQLNESKLLLFSPLHEVILMVLDGFLRLTLIFDKKDKWKT
jgi:hypothetical protein